MDTLVIFTLCCVAYTLGTIVLAVGRGLRRLWGRVVG